jgi:F-type H+-transporting ATPase subunit epsilon
MEKSELHVQVLSPKRSLANVSAKAVSVPGTMGDMQILPLHAPLVAEMHMGYLRVDKTEGQSLKYFVVGGYVNVFNNSVTVLADIAETPEEIDRKRVEDAKKRAEERLARREATTDMNRAQAALYRALARLKFIELVAKEKTH